MRELKFIVNGMNMEKSNECDFSNIVKGTKGYLKAVFDLSDEWKDCSIAASFFQNGKEYPRMLIGNECTIPEQALKDNCFFVQLTGMKENFTIKTIKVLINQE